MAGIPVVAERGQGGGWSLLEACRLARIEQIGPEADDGWVAVSLRFDVIEEACAYVLGFGPQMDVMEPAELRQMLIRRAEATVAFYTRRAGSTKKRRPSLSFPVMIRISPGRTSLSMFQSPS